MTITKKEYLLLLMHNIPRLIFPLHRSPIYLLHTGTLSKPLAPTNFPYLLNYPSITTYTFLRKRHTYISSGLIGGNLQRRLRRVSSFREIRLQLRPEIFFSGIWCSEQHATPSAPSVTAILPGLFLRSHLFLLLKETAAATKTISPWKPHSTIVTQVHNLTANS